MRSWLAGRHSLPADPLFVVFTVVATENHFLFDVGVGALVDVLAATVAVLLLQGAEARSVAVPARRAVTITGRSVT